MSLKFNLCKSNYMTFSINNTGQPTDFRLRTHDPTNNYNNRTDALTKIDHIRYFGIIFDKNMKWTDQIDSLNNKL